MSLNFSPHVTGNHSVTPREDSLDETESMFGDEPILLFTEARNSSAATLSESQNEAASKGVLSGANQGSAVSRLNTLFNAMGQVSVKILATVLVLPAATLYGVVKAAIVIIPHALAIVGLIVGTALLLASIILGAAIGALALDPKKGAAMGHRFGEGLFYQAVEPATQFTKSLSLAVLAVPYALSHVLLHTAWHILWNKSTQDSGNAAAYRDEGLVLKSTENDPSEVNIWQQTSSRTDENGQSEEVVLHQRVTSKALTDENDQSEADLWQKITTKAKAEFSIALAELKKEYQKDV